MEKLINHLLANLSVRLAIATAGLATVYTLGSAVYRLVFSQLAGFPGPKLAAATYWYEFYYDCIRQGKFVFEIERMHRKYGL